jgi:uncharacterized protein involved in exopolysaccharide biosynthesis
LDELIRFRQILAMKIASEDIDVKLPRTSMVEVVDRAMPPLRPSSPNFLRGLCALFSGAILSVVGLFLLLVQPKTGPAVKTA